MKIRYLKLNMRSAMKLMLAFSLLFAVVIPVNVAAADDPDNKEVLDITARFFDHGDKMGSIKGELHINGPTEEFSKVSNFEIHFAKADGQLVDNSYIGTITFPSQMQNVIFYITSEIEIPTNAKLISVIPISVDDIEYETVTTLIWDSPGYLPRNIKFADTSINHNVIVGNLTWDAAIREDLFKYYTIYFYNGENSNIKLGEVLATGNSQYSFSYDGNSLGWFLISVENSDKEVPYHNFITRVIDYNKNGVPDYELDSNLPMPIEGQFISSAITLNGAYIDFSGVENVGDPPYEIDRYQLYFANEADERIEAIAQVKNETYPGKTYFQVHLPNDFVIRDDADSIHVVSIGTNGKMSEPYIISLSLGKPRDVTFVDLDPEVDKLRGTIYFNGAIESNSIDKYIVYYVNSNGKPVGDSIGEVNKNSSSVGLYWYKIEIESESPPNGIAGIGVFSFGKGKLSPQVEVITNIDSTSDNEIISRLQQYLRQRYYLYNTRISLDLLLRYSQFDSLLMSDLNGNGMIFDVEDVKMLLKMIEPVGTIPSP